jgi:hypothetical protein
MLLLWLSFILVKCSEPDSGLLNDLDLDVVRLGDDPIVQIVDDYNFGKKRRKTERPSLSDDELPADRPKGNPYHKNCSVSGCMRKSRDGHKCIRHGGGSRCEKRGCTRAAVGAKRLCHGHGGAKRCLLKSCNSPVRCRGLCYHHLRALPDL